MLLERQGSEEFRLGVDPDGYSGDGDGGRMVLFVFSHLHEHDEIYLAEDGGRFYYLSSVKFAMPEDRRRGECTVTLRRALSYPVTCVPLYHSGNMLFKILRRGCYVDNQIWSVQAFHKDNNELFPEGIPAPPSRGQSIIPVSLSSRRRITL